VVHLVEQGGQRIFYSSALVKVHPRYHRLLHNFDLVITEGSFIRSKGLIRHDVRGQPFVHGGIPELIKFFQPLYPLYRRHALRNGSSTTVAASERKRESLGKAVRVITAYDGMHLDVSKLGSHEQVR
jgi:hypothetical protein